MSRHEFLRPAYLPGASARAMGICQGTIAESPDRPLPPADRYLKNFSPAQPALSIAILTRSLYWRTSNAAGKEARLARNSAIFTHNVLCKEVELVGIEALEGDRSVAMGIGEPEIKALDTTIKHMGESEFNELAWERFSQEHGALARRLDSVEQELSGNRRLHLEAQHPALFVYAALERHVQALVMRAELGF